VVNCFAFAFAADILILNSNMKVRGELNSVMLRIRSLLVCCFATIFCGCAKDPEQLQILVLTSQDQLDEHIGEVVIIRGFVLNTKIPTILGVDVESDSPDLRDEMAEATGLLERYTVTEEEIAKADYATRGAGDYYRLEDIDSGYDAPVRPVSP
jgi:hypothetical protein